MQGFVRCLNGFVHGNGTDRPAHKRHSAFDHTQLIDTKSGQKYGQCRICGHLTADGDGDTADFCTFNGLLDQLDAGKFSALKAIHKYLFAEIYDFAGELRNVNLAKGNFRFAPLMYLEAALENIDRMPQSTFDEIIEKYVEMNIAHPFREGNGRSTRIWLDLIFKTEIHKVVDWSKVDKEDYLLAMERSPIKDIEIKHILKAALTDDINSREVYMKGIDYSYYYEGYTTFRTEEL